MNANDPARGGRCALLAAVLTLAGGCASDQERVDSADFGDSVRRIIALQTAGPEAAGTGLDGVKAAAVLKAYQQDIARPKDVEKPLLIQIGKQ